MTMSRAGRTWSRWVALLLAVSLSGCRACPRSRGSEDVPPKGEVFDEARRVRRAAASFPAAGEDYFHDMDGGITLAAEEVRGRNAWIVWSGGNDLFWDGIS